MIKKLAYMEEHELATIYELTYKYGWIVSEEREEGWLPDKAYLEKAKIESELNPWIEHGLNELSETYTEYVYNHTADGWTERWMEMYEGAELPHILEGLKGWAKSGVSALGEHEIEQQFLQSIYETVGEDFFKQDIYYILGPQFIETYIEEMSDIEDQEKMEEAWEEQQSSYGPDVGAEDFIYNNDLEKPFEEYVAEAEYGTLNWFLDMYTVSDASEMFPTLATNEDFYKNLFFNSYIKNFPGLSETVGEVERVKDEVEAAKSAGIDEKIITFQLGLNTAHQFGTMADHLLGTSSGSGKAILDEISSGPKVNEWNRDLNRIFGSPVISKLVLQACKCLECVIRELV
jgi:hypothetical protein